MPHCYSTASPLRTSLTGKKAGRALTGMVWEWPMFRFQVWCSSDSCGSMRRKMRWWSIYRYRMKPGPQPIKCICQAICHSIQRSNKLHHIATGSGRIRSCLLSGFDSLGSTMCPVWLKKMSTWHTGLGISVPLDHPFSGTHHKCIIVWGDHPKVQNTKQTCFKLQTTSPALVTTSQQFHFAEIYSPDPIPSGAFKSGDASQTGTVIYA